MTCWGAQLLKSDANCVPDFCPGRAHFKNKFCESCRAGLNLPVSQVRAMTNELDAILNSTNRLAAGFWKAIPSAVGGGGSMRIVNNTRHCHAPQLVVFSDEIPPLAWGEIPAEWLTPDGQFLPLHISQGTLRPIYCGPFVVARNIANLALAAADSCARVVAVEVPHTASHSSSTSKRSAPPWGDVSETSMSAPPLRRTATAIAHAAPPIPVESDHHRLPVTTSSSPSLATPTLPLAATTLLPCASTSALPCATGFALPNYASVSFEASSAPITSARHVAVAESSVSSTSSLATGPFPFSNSSTSVSTVSSALQSIAPSEEEGDDQTVDTELEDLLHRIGMPMHESTIDPKSREDQRSSMLSPIDFLQFASSVAFDAMPPQDQPWKNSSAVKHAAKASAGPLATALKSSSPVRNPWRNRMLQPFVAAHPVVAPPALLDPSPTLQHRGPFPCPSPSYAPS